MVVQLHTIVEKMPTKEHAFLALLLGAEIYKYLEANPIGRAGVEARYLLDEHNSYIPDVSFLSNERLAESDDATQMPDLAVEIASPNDRRLQMRHKAQTYLQHGVRMVWLVFPDQQQIEVYTADDTQTLKLADTLDGGAVLPGFTLALSRIFA